MRKTLNTILLTGALLLVNSSEVKCQEAYNNPEVINYRKNPSFDRLIQYFKEKGFEIEEHLLNPKFEIYNNIDVIFRTSPETKAIIEVKKAKTEEEKQRMFNEQYSGYKKKLGLEGKKKNIKKFIKDYNYQLSFAEKEYGIKKEIIASIIGVESDFGKNIGKYYPFNSFVSLFIKGYKTDFAITELEQLLEFSRKNNVNIFDLKSSYAGAIGFGQFLPSSLNQFFIGDDIYNMTNNINSVANYISFYLKRTKNIEKSIFQYNRSEFYVKAVLELAENGK